MNDSVSQELQTIFFLPIYLKSSVKVAQQNPPFLK